MTAEEAIKEVIIYMPDTEAREVIIEALEKQIKKKPVSKQKFADLHLGFCPSCSQGINSEMCNCDKCGQAIDWSEGE